MGSMAQDAIDFGLDPVIAPDGRQWCDSAYTQSSDSREIWGDLQAGCRNRRETFSKNYDNDDTYDSDVKIEAHSERVWKRMGYRVKYGETYSYKLYGNEIYTADQVVRGTDRSEYGRRFHNDSSTYSKKRSNESHTYDDWQALGYQVRKGEKATRIGGRHYFGREQVAWIGFE